MLTILLIVAASAAFVGAVAKILDLSLRQPRAAGRRRPRQRADTAAGPPSPSVGRRGSKVGASSRLLIAVLIVAASISLAIVIIVGWLGGLIEEALS